MFESSRKVYEIAVLLTSAQA